MRSSWIRVNSKFLIRQVLIRQENGKHIDTQRRLVKMESDWRYVAKSRGMPRVADSPRSKYRDIKQFFTELPEGINLADTLNSDFWQNKFLLL